MSNQMKAPSIIIKKFKPLLIVENSFNIRYQTIVSHCVLLYYKNWLYDYYSTIIILRLLFYDYILSLLLSLLLLLLLLLLLYFTTIALPLPACFKKQSTDDFALFVE